MQNKFFCNKERYNQLLQKKIKEFSVNNRDEYKILYGYIANKNAQIFAPLSSLKIL